MYSSLGIFVITGGRACVLRGVLISAPFSFLLLLRFLFGEACGLRIAFFLFPPIVTHVSFSVWGAFAWKLGGVTSWLGAVSRLSLGSWNLVFTGYSVG